MPPTAPPATPVLCRIESADIAAMLDTYDSGMSDASTANCLSRAVSRLFNGGRPVPLIRREPGHPELIIAGHRVPVPPHLVEWLRAAEHGAAAGPLEFCLPLPAALTRPQSGIIPFTASRRVLPADLSARQRQQVAV